LSFFSPSQKNNHTPQEKRDRPTIPPAVDQTVLLAVSSNVVQVGVLLDEFDGASSLRLQERVLRWSDSDWKQHALAQLLLTNYRLVWYMKESVNHHDQSPSLPLPYSGIRFLFCFISYCFITCFIYFCFFISFIFKMFHVIIC
jgi:hypothetical protein